MYVINFVLKTNDIYFVFVIFIRKIKFFFYSKYKFLFGGRREEGILWSMVKVVIGF